MGFFLEQGRFGEGPEDHVACVYELLFPESRWEDVSEHGIRGAGSGMMPGEPNSQRIGRIYRTHLGSWRGLSPAPFLLRDPLPKPADRFTLRLALADILLEETDDPDPAMTALLEAQLAAGETFGGFARAGLGVFGDASGYGFAVHYVGITGISAAGRPDALVYFKPGAGQPKP
jgi:hypothetical protein